jgi:hypothetical protein
MKITFPILLAAFIFCISTDVRAVQKYSICPYPEHEISFGYGAFSAEQIGIKTGKIFGNKLLEQIVSEGKGGRSLSPIGPIFINYKYFFIEKVSIGAGVVYAKNSIETVPDAGLPYTDIYHSIAFLPSLDFYYVRNPKIAVYGALKAGPDVRLFKYADGSTDLNVGLAFQITPIGIRAGREFGFVLELGFGNFGVGNGGFSYRHYNRPWGT